MPADLLSGVELTVEVGAVDVSCDCLLVDVSYGRTRLWDPPSASVAQVVLDCGEDHQPPTRGPIGASVVVTLTYGAVSRVIFTGTVQQRRVESSPGPARPQAGGATQLYLDAVDAFERLARVNRIAATTDVAVGGGDTIDERLARWLTEADWGGATDLDTASTFTCPETLMVGNALNELQRTALADGGDFYIAGDGTATYRSWAWRNTVDDVTAIFSDRKSFDWVPYSRVDYRDDLDEVQNKVVGIRRLVDELDPPEPQTATNSSSVTTYGERGDPLEDLELEDDTQVATRVASQVESSAQPSPRFDRIVVQPAATPSRSWPRVIPIDFGSLIATNRLYPDGSQAALYGNVIGQRWRITPTDASVTLNVSGTGAWDAQRIPRTPISVVIDPVTGKVCVPLGYPCDFTSDVVFKDADGDVIATYPPGSLCYCEDGGGVVPPDGATQVCYVNEHGEICTDLEDPRLRAVLWFDVLEPGPDLIERVDGDAVVPGPGFLDTTLDVIPGAYDAINATATGGTIGGSHSTTLTEANLTDGWTIDLWLYLDDQMPSSTQLELVNLDSIIIRLTTLHGTFDVTQLEVVVVDEDVVPHTSGPIADVPTGDWHHWVIAWDPTSISFELTILMDGADPP